MKNQDYFNKEILLPIQHSIQHFADRNSFCISEIFYTYEQLGESISKIRSALSKVNIQNSQIGLVVNDDFDTYASILAIWFEGCSYVPLHPLQPIERSLEIIKQSDIQVIIDSSEKTKFADFNFDVIESSKLVFETLNLSPKLISDDNLAYILFTSGSTGTPKGVQITRNNIGAFMNSFWKTGVQINENDKCLQSFDLTFDVSVQSYLVPLIKGACTYTIPHDQIKYSYVYGLLEDHHITFGAMAPSMIRYLRPYFDEINVQSMKYCILTAEASPLDLIEEWANCIPNAEIVNYYGPTEATIYCTFQKFNRNSLNKQINGMLTIGKPMPGVNAIIVNEELQILQQGEKGELCVSGDQLTPGYWKNPTKNKESFFEIVEEGAAVRYYKTGDSCSFDETGDILLYGRLDYQVKIQGFRIELGEIEFHAREFLKGMNAVAIAYTNKIGNSEIALFVEGKDFIESELIRYLNSKMPYYMIPTKIIIENQFPINNSGKVDRVTLKGKL